MTIGNDFIDFKINKRKLKVKAEKQRGEGTVLLLIEIFFIVGPKALKFCT